MNARELRRICLAVAIALGLVVMVGRWQTKTLQEEVALLNTKCQFLEKKIETVSEQADQATIKLRNAEGSIARGEIALKAWEATRKNATEEPARYTVSLLHTVKLGFNDIQHHVAAGRFPGLALTEGYMELKQILDNPAFEEMLAREHGMANR